MAVEAERVERMLKVIAVACSGDYDGRIELEDQEDPLLGVELGINYLLDELVIRRDENDAQNQALREQAEHIAAQSQALLVALSTPIIALLPGVLVLPLIGDFDRARAENTPAVLLERVAAERSSHVLLDLTGIGSISAGAAGALLSMIRAVGLLGVTCLVTGIGPRIARDFVEFGADLGRMQTFARVSDALEIVLRAKNHRR